MSDLLEMYAQGLWAYISDKSQVPVLQPICNTSVKAESLYANTTVASCLKDVIMVTQQVTS